MKTKLLSTIALLLLIAISGCHSNQNYSDYCTVKGTVKGLKNGTKLELQDEFQHFKVIATTTVKDGAFEFHPDISSPTHVYLYVTNKKQLKDFILEPGTIFVEVDADDEEDYRYGAHGTPSNDTERRFRALADKGDHEAAKAIMDSIMGTEQTGALALDFANNICDSTAQMLDVLDHLTPELANLEFVAEFREDLIRRLNTEAGGMYIDMEYPDVDGNPISLSSVVNSKAWYDYSLSGIPTTVLIDCQTGIIIARDKKTDELDVMLDELLHK